jgi:hypothetical protein
MMSTPVRAREPDLRALAGIVSDHRDDLPAEGLPPSLLADLMGRSAVMCCGSPATTVRGGRSGSGRKSQLSTCQWQDRDRATWEYYWGCQPCSYPDLTGDLRSITMGSDFYSARQWHATGMYSDVYRPQG